MSAGLTTRVLPQRSHAHAERPAPPPPKARLFGVNVSLADPGQTLETIMSWARRRRPAIVDFMDVHVLMVAQRDADYKRRLNQFDMIACDGQPVRWALNRWHRAGIAERVYGPAMTLAVCRAAAEENVPVYFYGSRIDVLDELTAKLRRQFPQLRIVGAESPPFRPLTPEESAATIERINQSGAGVVFVGLGCPKQERFATEHRDRIQAVQLCVGAAFDLHAGLVRMAPAWMQRIGLEWCYRLMQEPRRLWKRYLFGNAQFIGMCLVKILAGDR